MANPKTKTSKKLTAKDLRLYYVTCPDIATAEKISQALLTSRLIACANILPGMKSLYWWKGQIEASQECLLFLKSSQTKTRVLMERIQRLHPYEVPCILELKLEAAAKAYGDWLLDELKV